jgi:hypothetical protein
MNYAHQLRHNRYSTRTGKCITGVNSGHEHLYHIALPVDVVKIIVDGVLQAGLLPRPAIVHQILPP